MIDKIERLELDLCDGPVSVSFFKKDGGVRQMKCTRDLELVPAEQHADMYDYRINGPDIIGVYDLEYSAWRSFRKDKVIHHVCL